MTSLAEAKAMSKEQLVEKVARKRAKPKKKVPIGVVAGALLSLAIAKPVIDRSSIARGMRATYTGVWDDGKWHGVHNMPSSIALFGGIGVSLLARKTGINRVLSDIPLVKL